MGYHDIFFKHTFSIKANAVDFLRHVLPSEINTGLDYGTICLDNTSYVDDDLSASFSDMVYSCYHEKSKILVALLFEHKSFPDQHLPYQLNKYMLNIWGANLKQQKEMIPVISIVLYHGKQRWKPGRLSSCFKGLSAAMIQFIPDFNYGYK